MCMYVWWPEKILYMMKFRIFTGFTQLNWFLFCVYINPKYISSSKSVTFTEEMRKSDKLKEIETFPYCFGENYLLTFEVSK